MSAEPQPEKEKTQEEAEAPKREEDGSQPGKGMISRWLWTAAGLIAAGMLAAVGHGTSTNPSRVDWLATASPSPSPSNRATRFPT